MKDLLRDFLAEGSEQLEMVGAQLAGLEGKRPDARILGNVFRLIDTLKGASGFLDLPRVEGIADAATALVSRLRGDAAPAARSTPLLLATVERIKAIIAGLDDRKGEPPGDDAALLAALRRAAAPDEIDGTALLGYEPRSAASIERDGADVCISQQALDRLTELVRRLVFTRNELSGIADSRTDPAIAAPLSQIFAVSDELREVVRAARTLRAEQIFPGYRAFAQAHARECGVEVEFAVDAGAAQFDRMLLHAVHEPLTALIRNALDHGLEPPEERLRLGKPECGAITLSAAQEPGAVTLTLTDDGRGFDAEWMRRRGFGAGTTGEDAAGLASGADEGSPPRSSLHRAIAAITQVGGEVALRSAPGKGASFTLRLPAKLAVEPAVIVVAGGERFALLRSAILQTFPLNPTEAPRADDHGDVGIEDFSHTPVVRLDAVLTGIEAPTQPRVRLHVQAGGAAFSLLVDDIAGFQDLVLEPLPSPLGPLPLFLGVAALADGTAAMVLDLAGLGAAIGACKSPVPPALRRNSPPVSSSAIVFRAHGESARALPISSETRIVRLTHAQSLQARQEGRAAIEGHSTPVAWLSDDGLPPSASTVLLLQEGEDRVALAVDEVIEIVREDVKLEFVASRPGALGIAAVRGAAIEVIDPIFYLRRRKRRRSPGLSPKRTSILLVEPDAYLRDMLAGAFVKRRFQVWALGDVFAAESAALRGDWLAGALIDLDAAAADEGACVKKLRSHFVKAAPPLYGLASHAGAAMQARGNALGLTCVFGKFDRHGMLGALAGAEALLAPEQAA